MVNFKLPTKENSISLEAWRKNPHFNNLHVWYHVTGDDRPFYVGRGRGAYAWERPLGFLWKKFVEDYLGGEYYVVISGTNLSDHDSSELIEYSLAQYHSTLLNRVNFYRPCNSGELDLRDHLNSELSPLYQSLKDLTDRIDIIDLCRTANNLQRKLDNVQTETGLYGDVLSTFPTSAVNMYFVKPLVEALLDEGLKEEAALELEQFLQCKGAVNYEHSATIVKLKKQVAAGKIRRRVAR